MTLTRTPTPRRPLRTLLATSVLLLSFGTPLALARALGDAATSTLQHMALDEKLAHDVYTTLATLYDVPTFAAIASSEATHLAAIQNLMGRYDVIDPTLGSGLGDFVDPDFQALYDDLVEQGSASLEAAAQVGITIEEIDIADLENAIAATSEADIDRVYTNLLNASESHLRSFTALAADPDAVASGAGPNGAGGPKAGARHGPANDATGADRGKANRGRRN
jgi:Uncharacterized protein conserved in archaea